MGKHAIDDIVGLGDALCDLRRRANRLEDRQEQLSQSIEGKLERVVDGQAKVVDAVNKQAAAVASIVTGVADIRRDLTRHESEIGEVEKVATELMVESERRKAVSGLTTRAARIVWDAKAYWLLPLVGGLAAWAGFMIGGG